MPILFGTNFSDDSRKAAEAMAAISARRKDTLLLAHALPSHQVAALGEPLRPMTQAALESEANRLRALGAQVEPLLLEGELHEVLARAAMERGCSLLAVTAPTGHAPLFGVDLRASRLLPVSTRPILVIRDAERLLAWAKGNRPLRVMFGTDRTDTSAAAQGWLDWLLPLGPLELTAVQLYWPAEEALRFGLPPPQYAAQESAEVEQFLENEVCSRLGRWPGMPPRIIAQPSFGRVADQLTGLAEQEGTDLLVIGSHRRRGANKAWSVSHHALRLATMSVAVVPSSGVPDAERPLQPIRRVLVATDLSSPGNAAVSLGFSLVLPGGTVHLLHVAPQEDATEERLNELQRRLERLVLRSPEFSSKRGVTEVIASGDPAAAILRSAEQLGADLICLGAQGGHGLRRAVFGSVVAEVMNRTTRPVVIVRPPPP